MGAALRSGSSPSKQQTHFRLRPSREPHRRMAASRRWQIRIRNDTFAWKGYDAGGRRIVYVDDLQTGLDGILYAVHLT